MTNGTQAEVFADHYIAVHLREIGQDKTYSEVSATYLALQEADPNDPKPQALGAERQTLLTGETLRGMLLNAYGFGTMGQIALVSAIVSFVAAGLLLLLSVLGLWHSRRVPATTQVLAGRATRTPVSA